jgi:hypothetical protein
MPPVNRRTIEGVDADGDRAVRAIDAAEADLAGLSGPVQLSQEYLRALERVEALPENQAGADKTWLWRTFERDRLHFARARRP